MALGFRVLQVQRAAKGLQSVVVRLFELVESLLEPRGAIFHLLLEIALIFSVFVDEPTMLQRAAHAQEKLVLFKRLQDVVVGAATDGFERRGDVVDRRDHNDGHVGVKLTHPFQKLDAIHLRHDHVAQNQVGSGAFDVFLRNAAVVRHRAAVAFGFEHRRNDFSNRFFVVHDKYVLSVQPGQLQAHIISDGTPCCPAACPVGK